MAGDNTFSQAAAAFLDFGNDSDTDNDHVRCARLYCLKISIFRSARDPRGYRTRPGNGLESNQRCEIRENGSRIQPPVLTLRESTSCVWL